MKKLMLFSAVLVLFVPLTAVAQDLTKPNADQAKQDNTKTATQENQPTATNLKTVTGCLQKGDQTDQFSITGADSKSWDLRSSTVTLTDHVGQQVTVTGSPTRDTKAEEKKQGQVEKTAGKEQIRELRVTGLKMVSQSCAS